MDAGGTALTAVVMVLGLFGTVLPLLPGLTLIWAAALVYGLADGFGPVATPAFVVITVLFIVGTAAKYVLPHRAGAARGADRTTLALAVILGLVGFFVIPGVGLIVGAVAGVLLGEYRRVGEWAPAWDATRAVLIGFGIGTLAELAAGVTMIAVWALWVVLR